VMESFLNDLKHSLRILRHTPSFTITAVAVLALGIGANTAIFTVVDAVILNPLPYPDSDRIVNISHSGGGSLNPPTFIYLEKNALGFRYMAGYQAARRNLSGGDQPERLEAVTASRNYFRLFGANPILGRTFTADEDKPGTGRVLVMSYGLWQRRFAGDASIVGRTITLDGLPYGVVGVLSPGFKPYPPADVWLPLDANLDSRNLAGVLTVSGRLPAVATLAQANAEVRVLGRQFAQTQTISLSKGDPKLEVAFMREQITGDVRPALMILLGAVGLVLLIACANVANLLLARATVRQREIAIRAAIGAGRGRIVRQLLTESLLLALTSGALGLALGWWATRVLLAFAPADFPRIPEIAAIAELDPRVGGFTLLLAAATGVLFGSVPAFRLSRLELTTALKDSSSGTGAGRGQSRSRSTLVAAEVAIAVVLLCGAVLLIRSFAAMHNVSLGFDPHNLLTMEVSLSGPRYAKSSGVDRLAEQFVGRIERIPGVESAALASALPLSGGMDMIFNIPGRVLPSGRPFMGDVQWRFVSAHYFEVLRIPLRAGRLPHDGEPGRAVVISQTMAHKFWPGANPVGQTIFIGPGLGPAYEEGIAEIAGVVGDVRERLNIEPQPVIYQPPWQIPDAAMALVTALDPTAILVRTRPGVEAMSVSRDVRTALLGTDQLPVAKVRTMERASLDSTERQNFNMLLLSLFAAIALLLAAGGIYGVMSYSVEQRTHEIGIRSALGANRRDTLALVLVEALRMAMVGIAVGMAASYGLTRLLSAQLFGVKPLDPLTFEGVPLILIVVALAAACVPALRATRVEPLTALRHH